MRPVLHAASDRPKRRTRKTPRSNQVTYGFPEIFADSDVDGLVSIARLPLALARDRFVYRLNEAAHELFVQFAIERATPPSKTAEWVEAIKRDTEQLMSALEIDLTPFPPRGLSHDARSALIWYGPPEGLQRKFIERLGIGDEMQDWLRTTSNSLWALRCLATHAAAEWRRISKRQRGAASAGNKQHRTFLRYLAILYRDAFGKLPPATRPNAAGPFIRFVDNVRLRILAYDKKVGVQVTDMGTDPDAIRRLRMFTPSAAASLWFRNAPKLLKNLPPAEMLGDANRLPDSGTTCTPLSEILKD